MKTDIIILTKTPTLLDSCLRSLNKHADKSKVGKVIVGITAKSCSQEELDCIDNAVHNGNQYDSSYLPVQTVCLGFYNFAKNCNTLAKMCKSECILFMNDDVELTEDAITPCLDILEHDDRVGTVGIKLLYPDGSIQHGGIFLACYNGQPAVGHIDFKKKSSSVGDIWTVGNTAAFMMVRTKDFNWLQGFPEGYDVCFEDVQYNITSIVELCKMNVTLNTVSAVHAESQTRKDADMLPDLLKLQTWIVCQIGRMHDVLLQDINTKYVRQK